MNDVSLPSIDVSSFPFYSRPTAAPITIEPPPRLDSWMKRDHPDQERLRAYLDWTESRVRPAMRPADNAISLTVALPLTSSLDAGGHDLDNYLFPLVRRLGAGAFVSAWASKRHSGRSCVTVDTAAVGSMSGPAWHVAFAETNEVKDSAAWKRDIDRRIRRQVDAPADGPVELQISYIVSPSWNWSTLWKPTIDALASIVGEGRRPFQPRDDRIVTLGLHRKAEPTRTRGVKLAVWWRRALVTDAGTTLSMTP